MKRRRAARLIFLSHSTKDRWIARQMALILEGKGRVLGLQVFLDEKSIEGGESISEAIRTNLERCDEVLLLLSKYSVDRPWVLAEMGAAWGLRKRIVPVIDKLSPAEMPDLMRDTKAWDLNDFDKCVAEILRRARGRS